MADENTNCLGGMRCPNCGSLGPYVICATVFVEVSDNGIEDTFDHEWNLSSYCRCVRCDFMATVEDFTIDAGEVANG